MKKIREFLEQFGNAIMRKLKEYYNKTIHSLCEMSSKMYGKSYAVEIFLLCLILIGYAAHSLCIGSYLLNYATNKISWLHVESIADMSNILSNCSFRQLFKFLPSKPYPPIYLIEGAIITLIFGRNWVLLNLIHNSPYLVILLIFTYLLGREIKDRRTGIIAALFLALFPPVYGGFIDFIIDYPLMGLMSLCIYCLYKSDLLRELKWSVLFGIGCGWGLMIKDTFAVFIIGPIVYAFVRVLVDAAGKNYKPLRNTLVVMLIVAAMISPYYFDLGVLKRVLYGPMNEPSSDRWCSWRNLRFITVGICESQLSPPFFLAFVSGLFIFFRKQIHRGIKWLTLLWILIPNLIIFLMPHWKTVRYLMPVLPAYALIGAVGMGIIVEKWYGKVILSVIVLAGILQYFSITYGRGLLMNSNGFIYYRCADDVNPPLYQRISESKIYSAVYKNIARRISGNKSEELHVFVPFLNCYVNFFCDWSAYFWFQNMRVRKLCPFETCIHVGGGGIDLDNAKKELKNGEAISSLIIQKTCRTKDAIDSLNENQLVNVFNDILDMPDLYKLVNADTLHPCSRNIFNRRILCNIYPLTFNKIFNIKQYDFMLFCLSGEDDTDENGKNLPFGIVKKKWYERMANHQLANQQCNVMPNNGEMKIIEIWWKELLQKFKTRELICRDRDFSVYLYGR